VVEYVPEIFIRPVIRHYHAVLEYLSETTGTFTEKLICYVGLLEVIRRFIDEDRHPFLDSIIQLIGNHDQRGFQDRGGEFRELV
jgi:hypothetical protein